MVLTSKNRTSTIMKQTLAQHVGNRIRKRRLKLNLTQIDILNTCNITGTLLSKFEDGKNNIGIHQLYALSKVLKRDLNWFTKGFEHNC